MRAPACPLWALSAARLHSRHQAVHSVLRSFSARWIGRHLEVYQVLIRATEFAMQTENLLDLFNSHTGTVNVLWGFLSTVALGVLGFAYKDGNPVGSNHLRWALTLGFLLFGVGNCTAMHRSSEVLYQISLVPSQRAAKDAEIAEVLRAHAAVDPVVILAMQILFILVVLAVLWIPPLMMGRRQRGRAAS